MGNEISSESTQEQVGDYVSRIASHPLFVEYSDHFIKNGIDGGTLLEYTTEEAEEFLMDCKIVNKHH